MKKRGVTLSLILFLILSGCHPSTYLTKDQYVNIKKNDRLEIVDRNEKQYKIDPVRKIILTNDTLRIFERNSQPLVLPLKDISELAVANLDYPASVVTGILIAVPAFLLVTLVTILMSF